jgi:benzoyl-CoA reductase/2-hydroxyglutaryl-CoA dehydratase subunit BcrC/BadD/HgdB
MWTELGLNLDNHDALIASQSRLHEKTHLWQKNRPDAMKMFDEALHASHAERLAEIRDYREEGGKAIGTFCIYVPDEIALAADVLPVPLCGGSGWPVDYADKMLPRDICPLVRSTFGMAFSGTCPYGKLTDFMLGETTCDAKKKAWDLFGFEVLEVPQKKAEIDRELWREEVRRFKDMVEELSGVMVTPEKLAESTRLVNRKRLALQRVNDFRKLDEPAISGLDALLVAQTALSMDVKSFIAAAEELAEELYGRAKRGVSAYGGPGMRVMVAGSPSPMGYSKVHYVLESSSMRVVCDESCTGVRYFRDLVDESPADLDGQLRAIADRYFEIDCSCFSPNSERMENVRKLVEEYNVQGVVHGVLQYCHAYDIESKAADKVLAKMGIPSTKIVTDYSEEDVEKLRVRVEAFAEVSAS